MSESLADFIRRVEDFEIDPGLKEFTFAARLARENRWSLLFAERVILEYKRFCILAVQLPATVQPAPARRYLASSGKTLRSLE